MQRGGVPFFLIVILIAALAVGGYFAYTNYKNSRVKTEIFDNVGIQQSPEYNLSKDDINQIKAAIAAKSTNTSAEQVIISRIDEGTIKYAGKFAVGSGSTKDSAGGYKWFAAKIDNKWTIAAMGNGIPTCEEIESYNLPADLLKGCVKSNEVIDRNTNTPFQ